MTSAPKNLVLSVGNTLALVLQVLCALGGAVAVLTLIVVALASLDLLTGIAAVNEISVVEASPLAAIGIMMAITTSLTALFLLFGKMRAIIGSVSKGSSFVPENARRLEAMAWLVLIHEVAALFVGELRIYAANLVDGQGTHSSEYSLYDLDGPFIVLLLFILARIFQQGAAMRDDLEGTV